MWIARNRDGSLYAYTTEPQRQEKSFAFGGERLIEIFTDKGDVVIDPCAGSGTTLLAAANCGRRAYGFEIKKDFYKSATSIIMPLVQRKLF